jgi:hypothetical protein
MFCDGFAALVVADQYPQPLRIHDKPEVDGLLSAAPISALSSSKNTEKAQKGCSVVRHQ